jgi:hypothetical protein
MDDENTVHVQYTSEYYSTIKQREVLSLVAPWMESEIIMLSEIIQAQEDKYHRSHSCVQSGEAHLIETECRMVVIRDLGEQGKGRAGERVINEN